MKMIVRTSLVSLHVLSKDFFHRLHGGSRLWGSYIKYSYLSDDACSSACRINIDTDCCFCWGTNTDASK